MLFWLTLNNQKFLEIQKEFIIYFKIFIVVFVIKT